jgi:hypothetical protein
MKAVTPPISETGQDDPGGRTERPAGVSPEGVAEQREGDNHDYESLGVSSSSGGNVRSVVEEGRFEGGRAVGRGLRGPGLCGGGRRRAAAGSVYASRVIPK